MPRDGVAFAAGRGVRPFHHIDPRPVVLQEVEIHGGEFGQRMPQIAHRGDGLEEYLGQQYGGADVEINAALVEVRDQATEEAEVAMGGAADGSAVRRRVDVRGIGADGDVHGDGNAGAVRVEEQAGVRRPVAGATLVTLVERAPQRFPHADAVADAYDDGLRSEERRVG